MSDEDMSDVEGSFEEDQGDSVDASGDGADSGASSQDEAPSIFNSSIARKPSQAKESDKRPTRKVGPVFFDPFAADVKKKKRGGTFQTMGMIFSGAKDI